MEDIGSWLQLLNLPIGGLYIVLILTGKLVPWSWVLRYLDQRQSVAEGFDKLATAVEKNTESQQASQEKDETILHAVEELRESMQQLVAELRSSREIS